MDDLEPEPVSVIKVDNADNGISAVDESPKCVSNSSRLK